MVVLLLLLQLLEHLVDPVVVVDITLLAELEQEIHTQEHQE